ncbi:hypothetical protein [Streptomyces sp. NBC_00576]|uniref:hypothetical protein n=1 Tax=Streptomyces sp. NBC_00576 TaxID=2903665 RepID=UPI002E80ADBB|nr:hypothetical protein [Streptomyces sp. NBC_00576]WUB76914.1 hypothetical protein OG734_46590 [Streptomyces sp. NBC_00576]
MIDSDHTQPPALRRNRVLDALKRAERKVFTRPALKSAKAQMEFLYTRAKQSTKALAEQLGVSPRTVQRYRAGQQTKPQKKLRAALVEETDAAVPGAQATAESEDLGQTAGTVEFLRGACAALLVLGLSASVRSLYAQYATSVADFTRTQADSIRDDAIEIWQGHAVLASVTVTIAGIAW